MKLSGDRPQVFDLDRAHPLHRGLVFAGLGRTHGSLEYRDSSWRGNHGTLTNGPTWVFDGTLGRFVVSGNGSSHRISTTLSQLNTSYTVSCWCKFNALNKYQYAVSCDTASSGRFFVLGAGTDSYSPAYAVVWNASDALAELRTSGGTPVFSTGTWFHLCLQYAPGAQRYLVNGKSIASATLAGDAKTGTPTTSLMYAENGAVYFDGSVSDCLIHSRVLSLAEIQQLADPSNAMLSGLILPPRRRWWPVATSAPAVTYKPMQFQVC